MTENHQCAYSQGHQRCCLPGTMTDTTQPSDKTRWYCRYHTRALRDHDPAYGHQIIQESENNSPERFWMDELMDQHCPENSAPKQEPIYANREHELETDLASDDLF